MFFCWIVTDGQSNFGIHWDEMHLAAEDTMTSIVMLFNAFTITVHLMMNQCPFDKFNGVKC